MIRNKNQIKQKKKKKRKKETDWQKRVLFFPFSSLFLSFSFSARWRAMDYKRGTNNSGRVTRHRIKTDARYISRAWSSPLCPGKNARRFARSGCETFSNSSRRSRYAARIPAPCRHRRRGRLLEQRGRHESPFQFESWTRLPNSRRFFLCASCAEDAAFRKWSLDFRIQTKWEEDFHSTTSGILKISTFQRVIRTLFSNLWFF